MSRRYSAALRGFEARSNTEPGTLSKVGEHLGALVRADEVAHLPDERRVVDAPESPFGEGERLPRVRLVEPVAAAHSALPRDVVEVVADDVDEAVARVVGLRAISGDVRGAVALGVPDHAEVGERVARQRVHGATADRRDVERGETRVDLAERAAVGDQVDAGEGLAEPARLVSRLDVSRAGERAVPVPVPFISPKGRR